MNSELSELIDWALEMVVTVLLSHGSKGKTNKIKQVSTSIGYDSL